MDLSVGLYNVLADGLALGEFATYEGDAELVWVSRGPKVVEVIVAMLERYDVVVTVENDHFFSILDQLREITGSDVHGVFGRKRQAGNCDSTCRKLMKARVDISGAKSLREETVPPFLDYYFSGAGDGTEPVGEGAESASTAYLSDDGVGIYFKSDKVLRHECVLLPGQTILPGGALADPIVLDIDAGAASVAVVFSTSSGGGKFLVVGSHLPSGEGMKQEEERREVAEMTLKAVLDMGYGHLPIVWGMDSNTSQVYVDNMVSQGHLLARERSLVRFLEHSGFTSYIPECGGPHFKCFKMRHARGNQVNKFCTFMYVCIDKVLLRLPPEGNVRVTRAEAESLTEKLCGLSAADESALLKLRDEDAGALRSLFFGVPESEEVPYFPKEHDVSAVVSAYPFAWGDRIKERLTDLPSETASRFSILAKLFPSSGMPSDHPAVGVFFSLSPAS